MRILFLHRLLLCLHVLCSFIFFAFLFFFVFVSAFRMKQRRGKKICAYAASFCVNVSAVFFYQQNTLRHKRRKLFDSIVNNFSFLFFFRKPQLRPFLHPKKNWKKKKYTEKIFSIPKDRRRSFLFTKWELCFCFVFVVVVRNSSNSHNFFHFIFIGYFVVVSIAVLEWILTTFKPLATRQKRIQRNKPTNNFFLFFFQVILCYVWFYTLSTTFASLCYCLTEKKCRKTFSPDIFMLMIA